MVAVDRWRVPSDIGTVTGERCRVQYIGGYWIAVSWSASHTTVRASTSPASGWVTASVTAAPAGFTDDRFVTQVAYDGTTWAFVTTYIQGLGVSQASRVLFTTDPQGTWAAFDYLNGSTNKLIGYRGGAFTYGNGEWVATGTYDTGPFTPLYPAVAHNTTISGSYWTVETGYTQTGYDTSAMPAAVGWNVTSIIYDGTDWISTAYRSDTFEASMRTSTALTSGWTTPTLPTFYARTACQVRCASNGVYTVSNISDAASGGNTDRILYATSPTGTWSLTSSGLIATGGDQYATEYADGLWMTATEFERMSVQATTGNPTGAWRVARGMTATSGDWPMSIATDGTTVMTGWTDGGVLYGYADDAALRQRQSPRSNPTRVGQIPRLRQRQTFI